MDAQEPAVAIDSLYPNAEQLGAKPIDEALIAKIAEVCKGQAPLAIRRQIFNAHVGFDGLVDGKKFYVLLQFTPTDRLTHLRHYVVCKLAKQLQDAFGCYVVIHVNDSKALLRDPKIKWDAVDKATLNTCKDILGFGFSQEKTILLLNTQANELDYVMLCDLQRKVTLGDFTSALFKDDSVNVGTLDVVFQTASMALPCYLSKIFPHFEELSCLMLCRPSQKPLYDFACRMATMYGQPTPCVLYGGFVPALQSRQKMPKQAKLQLRDKSVDYMTIYLKNTDKEIQTKLNKFAFSGGQDSKTDQQTKGANLAVDVPFYLLRLFMEDDAEFERIRKFYGPGELEGGNEQRLLTGNVKTICGDCLKRVFAEYRSVYNKVTPDTVKSFTAIRALQ